MSGRDGIAVGAPMRDRYSRFVALSNKGARELGFADTGVLWRSNYDMPPDAFAAEVDRLWTQVRPLYVSLHTYVRSKLAEKYGAGRLPDNGMLPAHLLGNMWAQDWANIYPLVAPPASGDGYDLTAELKRRKVDERGMVRYAERFFTSLGYQPLPPAFWERSLFTKPADREVVCHASASGWGAPEDVRIKMCIEVNAEDFQVVHHELGHNYYGLLYAKQPYSISRRRDRRVPRSGRRLDRALGDARIPEGDRPHRPGAVRESRPRISPQDRAEQSRVPPVQRDDRSVALESLLRRDHACPATTRRGGTCATNTRASPLRSRGRKATSIRAPSTMCRQTRRTRDIFSPTSCSFSFIARSARKRDSPARCIAVRFTETRRQERSSRRCSRWAAAGPGPKRSRC